jgi:multiple sugar transport system permease protein
MYQFKLKRIAFLFIILVMMVPSQVSASGLVMMCQDMGLISPSSGALAYIPLIVPAQSLMMQIERLHSLRLNRWH